MRLMVYSHDAFGLGNIRRMLAICQHLLTTFPDSSILVVSGSPALHSLRLPNGLDYIKLPCLGRDAAGKMQVKYLATTVGDTIKLRSDLILAAAANFQPDLLLVDKKPDGLQGELQKPIAYLKTYCPQTKLVLLLRDVLDAPAATIQQWQQQDYYRLIDAHYDQVWVVGMPAIFDVRREYQFPATVARKVRFCGYIRRSPGHKSRADLRRELAIPDSEPLVLVTPGGGGDGYPLVATYLQGLAAGALPPSAHHLIISGPEMPTHHRQQLSQRAAMLPNTHLLEFSDDVPSYLAAADVVVAMGGHNTVSEILSLQKRAIVVPRIAPAMEQWIRAERMAALGLLRTIHPDRLSPSSLSSAIVQELDQRQVPPCNLCLDMNALPRIANLITSLLNRSNVIPVSFEPSSPKYHAYSQTSHWLSAQNLS